MKKVFLLLLVLNIVSSSSLLAQDALTYISENKSKSNETPTKVPATFEFNALSRDYELDNITTEMAGEHPLGNLVAKKLYLLDEKYTSQVPLVPGNPQTKTLIKKPVIYDAVKRIDKHLKKSVKKGELTIDSATYDMNKVLDVALNVLTSNTEAFEEAIKSSADIQSRIELFSKRVNLIY